MGEVAIRLNHVTRWVALAIFGGVLCTLGDHLHATHDVLSYPSPMLGAQAWWVPLLFMGATLAVVRGAQLFTPADAPLPSPRVLGADLLSFCLAYGITSFTHTLPNVTLALLVLWWLARVTREESRGVIFYSLTLAALGTAFEAALSSTGAFSYHHADFFGVPRWLPGIYLHAAPIAARLPKLTA